jgi:hypothetical protein
VNVDVRRMSFFDGPPFAGSKPVLAAAFVVRDINYRWERGVRYALAAGGAPQFQTEPARVGPERREAAYHGASLRPGATRPGSVVSQRTSPRRASNIHAQSRFQGVGQIIRFNWTHYAAAAVTIAVALVAAAVFRAPPTVPARWRRVRGVLAARFAPRLVLGV